MTWEAFTLICYIVALSLGIISLIFGLYAIYQDRKEEK